MNRLISYLLENLIIDFQGDLTLEMVRDFLRNDSSQDAQELLGRLINDHGTSEMMITLADCLKENIRSGIDEEVVREQLRMYSES